MEAVRHAEVWPCTSICTSPGAIRCGPRAIPDRGRARSPRGRAAADGRTDVLGRRRRSSACSASPATPGVTAHAGGGALARSTTSSPRAAAPLDPDVRDRHGGAARRTTSATSGCTTTRPRPRLGRRRSTRTRTRSAPTSSSSATVRPGSSRRPHTLAHELTHVVQQRSGPVDGTAAPRRHQGQRPGRPVRARGLRQRRAGDVHARPGAEPVGVGCRGAALRRRGASTTSSAASTRRPRSLSARAKRTRNPYRASSPPRPARG